MIRVFSILTCLAIALFWAPTARAQADDVTANVDANEIELGDTVTYVLTANSARAEPKDPRLTVPNGMTVVNTGASPSHMVSIMNGQKTEKHGLTATWILRSDRLGTFTVGPATIMIAGSKRSGNAQRVTVVAPGSGKPRPRRPKGRPGDPFGGSGWDPFKGLFGSGIDDEPPPSADPYVGINADPKLALARERAPGAFLHAVVDKSRAVVGEQVTLAVYLYEDIRGRPAHPVDVHEATATEFVKRTLMADETRATYVGNAIVGGSPWTVKLVRKSALFPLKTGKLSISPMSLTLSGVKSGLRESESLDVDVQEPTLSGRPAGYTVGDTGDFSLSATMTPRTIDQHGAVGVTVELRGTGNMPAKLQTPEVGGVEWLDPQTRDSLGPMDRDRFGGTRTFQYVVRVHNEGPVDLGEIRLPYYDPNSRTYQIARAAIGIVQVAKSAARPSGPDVSEAPLSGMPQARTKLEGRHVRSFVSERPYFWAGLFGLPLACALGIATAAGLRRLRDRRASSGPSPDKIARDRLREADAALRGTDGKAAAAAVARAVEADLLARTGVNVRGTAAEGATRELASAGASDEAAREILAVLAACEDARFSPHDVAVEEAKTLWRRARAALDAAAGSIPPPSRGS